ncbi:MAG TPA: hypothetical protein VHD84_02165 [Candidatus Saccharimonadales bacterium]|nr:hypothetical protein [Candidatus Saccharimonadales bacterium]
MAPIESQSEVARHNVRGLLVPTWPGVVLYCLLSTVLIAILNSGSIINKLSNNYIGSPKNLKTNFSTLYDSFSNSFSSALGGRLGQILLWAFIGALVYIAIWFSRNVFSSFENDVIIYRYLHPSNYRRASYLESSITVKLFLAALALIFAGYLFVMITGVLPAVAALAGSAAYNYHAASLLYILFSILGIALALYIGMLLLRLISRLWKLL